MEKRIAIIGYSGSGKSTLAQKLGDKYNCQVLHLDRVHWLPGWRERDSAEQNAMVAEFMDRHSEWVIDGNYTSTCYARRLSEATDIIFLDFPVHICLYRAIKRYFANRGNNRDSMTEGCEEKIDREFLWWILHEGRDKSHRERYRKVCEEYAEKVTVLKAPRAVRNYYSREGKVSMCK